MTKPEHYMNRPMLIGSLEVLIGDTKPEKGVELTFGDPSEPGVTTYVDPDRADELVAALHYALRSVREQRKRSRS